MRWNNTTITWRSTRGGMLRAGHRITVPCGEFVM
jgi:hypothetical protein